mmetsp:Transcript_139614/g.389423  ORF Transcript_139614/g.389423 Transcript_139614/m.389423 type:complete len:108 (+) Transcript_139614:79-402(+)|eukprot:CAMPEP_0179142870 /NCGR_PEP_ID=MMETSP0796-20121207/68657_1 /TAXON_ID=73915 /ORGANISM="Pyrodinium bahamense, Strain pbaha01" /LENGTH=107 /DNA_ID=CAMNT_0020842803 /DNA_START=71 /DNA_END=394 /DNA_ORIENTATION=-
MAMPGRQWVSECAAISDELRRPLIVTPFLGEQYFHGRLIAALGVGVNLADIRHLSHSSLAASLRGIAFNSSVKSAARTLAVQLKQESGVPDAVAVVNDMLEMRAGIG